MRNVNRKNAYNNNYMAGRKAQARPCYDTGMINKLDTPGERLRILRRARGETHASLSAKVGLKPAIISRLESDDVSPSIHSIEKIAQLLGTSIDWLRCMPGTTLEKWQPGAVDDVGHSAEGQEILMLVDGLPADARQMCLKLIRDQVADYLKRREENEKTMQELTRMLEDLGIGKDKIEQVTQTVLAQ